jgi:hypothetical protein
MKYISIPDIKLGMIGLSGGKAWIQRQIMFFTGSEYSHSFIIVPGVSGLDALETTDTIVCTSPMERKVHESNEVEIWDTSASEDDRQFAWYTVYVSYAAKWYGYLSYIWFMYRWLMRNFGKEPKVMWKWCTHGVTCTELNVKYLSLLGPEYRELFKDLDLNAQSPEELKQIMIKNPKLFTYIGNLKREC